MAREDRKLNSRARKLILLALALVIAAAAVVVFLNRDAIADISIRDIGRAVQRKPEIKLF